MVKKLLSIKSFDDVTKMLKEKMFLKIFGFWQHKAKWKDIANTSKIWKTS